MQISTFSICYKMGLVLPYRLLDHVCKRSFYGLKMFAIFSQSSPRRPWKFKEKIMKSDDESDDPSGEMVGWLDWNWCNFSASSTFHVE
jgi:hypothetical protein